MAQTAFAGDIGTLIAVKFVDQDGRAVSLAGYIQIFLDIKKPGGVILTRALTLTTDGSDGKAQYTVVLGDFDVSGTYTFEAFVKLSSGQWSTTTDTVQVNKPLVAR